MARVAAAVAFALVAVAASLRAAPAELATLHVRAFRMSADRATLHAGESFVLTILANTAEPLSALDNVTLPNLSAFEELGDERRCSPRADGTVCTETLTLRATAPGEQAIDPVELDAVDARTHRPSRFLSERVVVTVVAAGPAPSDVVASLLHAIATVLEVSAVVGSSAFALVWGYRQLRGPAPVAQPQPAVPSRAIEDDSARERFAKLVAALAREPTRARVVAVRAELRARAGARDDETLADLLARRRSPTEPDFDALRAIERAAFCRDDDVAVAVAEALPYLH